MPGVSSQLSLSEQGSVFPGKVPLLGHLPIFFWSLWHAHGNLASAFERLFRQVNQQTFRIKLGPQWCILSIDPDVMHHILVTEFSQHTKTQRERDVLHPSMAGGLITAEGEEWKAHRQIFRPFFGTDYLKRLPMLAREAVTDRVSQWHDLIDVGSEMQMITFDIIARFFLGGKIGHYEGEEVLDFYINHLMHMEKVVESRVFSFPLIKDSIINSLKFKTKFHKSIQAIKDFISHRILKSADEEHSILQELLKEFGSKDVVVQEMFNIICASVGSAHVLTWICALLAQDPDRQKKLKTEIAHFFSGGKAKNGITLEQLEQLTYLTAVIHEGLRLYPPAPYIIRTLEARPAAPLIILSIWSMHRHPALWTQPEAFEPERWLVKGDTTEASPDTARQLRTFAAFLPFGAGPRMCIGRGFALAEIKLILIDIMQRFALRLVEPDLPAAKAAILTRPKQRIRLQVEPVTDVQDA
jgi:cytochrome P450